MIDALGMVRASVNLDGNPLTDESNRAHLDEQFRDLVP